MQLPAFLAVIVLALASVDARPIGAARRNNALVTMPIRRVQRDTNLHVDLRHQQHINRAERLAARAAGLPGPSDSQLRANLERRASFLEPAAKRFNVPPPGFGSATAGSDDAVSNLTVEDDETSDNNSAPPTLAHFSSEVDIDGVDTSYVATVQLGTPSRDFSIILDSGSGDFWVQSDQCTGENGSGCGNHTFISEDTSSTFVNTRKQWSITYGSGSASGDIVKDTLVLGGMLIDNHTFGAAHAISQSFSGDIVADGLMGLGKSSLSTQNVPTPVEALRNAGFFSAAITSYRLPRLLDHTNNGEVTFGGLDPTKFDASTLVTIDATDDPFWIAPMDGVTVNGVNVQIQSTQGLMDTGTTLLVVPEKDAVAIHAAIPGAKQQGSGQFTVPCDTTASVALKFGGREFAIDPKDLLFASGGRATGDCTSGIGSFSDTKFLVGDTFLKSVYFSTNVDANTISLAKAV